jgi:hypothetical protein
MKFLRYLLAFLAPLLGAMAANAEVTDAQLFEMVKQQRYVFKIDRPTTPPREIDAVFDLDGFHLIDRSKVFFSRGWIEIKQVAIDENLFVIHFMTEPDFFVPRADLKYRGVEEQFLAFTLDQIVHARLPKQKIQDFD